MNLVILVGNLTRDPEVRQAANGMAVCNLNIAVNKTIKKEGGAEADFFRVTTFGKTAELCERYLSKGRKVGIEGRIENNNYEKEGKTVYQDQIIANRVEFLSPKGESGSGFGGGESAFSGYSDPAPAPAYQAPAPSYPAPAPAFPPASSIPDAFASLDDEGDDLPF